MPIVGKHSAFPKCFEYSAISYWLRLLTVVHTLAVLSGAKVSTGDTPAVTRR